MSFDIVCDPYGYATAWRATRSHDPLPIHDVQNPQPEGALNRNLVSSVAEQLLDGSFLPFRPVSRYLVPRILHHDVTHDPDCDHRQPKNAECEFKHVTNSVAC